MLATVDLHNHSCLSPCASLEMSPSRIAELAAGRGVDLIALTDHNAALNCPAFAAACGDLGIAPLFGLELNSIEEVHVLAIFGTPSDALEFGAFALEHLQPVPWDPDKLGDQVVVDRDENVLDMPETYFGASLDVGFDHVCARAAERGAIVIPAHVDRPRFSVSSQLGFLPRGPYDAVESMLDPPRSLSGGLAAISGSDAHAPEQVGRRPFRVELDGNLLDAAASAAAHGGGEAGRRLLEALRRALRSGAVHPTRPPAK